MVMLVKEQTRMGEYLLIYLFIYYFIYSFIYLYLFIYLFIYLYKGIFIALVQDILWFDWINMFLKYEPQGEIGDKSCFCICESKGADQCMVIAQPHSWSAPLFSPFIDSYEIWIFEPL